MIRVHINALTWAISALSEYRETLRICGQHNIPLQVDPKLGTTLAIAHENMVSISKRLGLPVSTHLAEKAQQAYNATRGSVALNGNEITAYRTAVEDFFRTFYQESKLRHAHVLQDGRAELLEQTEPLSAKRFQ